MFRKAYAKSKNTALSLTFITLTNPILQLIGLISAICGWVVLNFILIVYISVKRLGGTLERRHILVICSVAALLFVGAILLTILAGTV
jgi:hypothetical protein